MSIENIHNDEFDLTPDYGLTTMERAIADLYRGGDKKGAFTGNKTRCYMAFHPRASEKTAAKRASELFKKPAMIAYLDTMAEKVAKQATMTALDVLNESIEHLKVCKGEEARRKQIVIEGEVIDADIQEYDISGVKNAIELIGRNINVNAFKDVVDHNMNGHEAWIAKLAEMDRIMQSSVDDNK